MNNVTIILKNFNNYYERKVSEALFIKSKKSHFLKPRIILPLAFETF